MSECASFARLSLASLAERVLIVQRDTKAEPRGRLNVMEVPLLSFILGMVLFLPSGRIGGWRQKTRGVNRRGAFESYERHRTVKGLTSHYGHFTAVFRIIP